MNDQVSHQTKELKFMSVNAFPNVAPSSIAREIGWPGIYANDWLYSLAKNMTGFPSLHFIYFSSVFIEE